MDSKERQNLFSRYMNIKRTLQNIRTGYHHRLINLPEMYNEKFDVKWIGKGVLFKDKLDKSIRDHETEINLRKGVLKFWKTIIGVTGLITLIFIIGVIIITVCKYAEILNPEYLEMPILNEVAQIKQFIYDIIYYMPHLLGLMALSVIGLVFSLIKKHNINKELEDMQKHLEIYKYIKKDIPNQRACWEKELYEEIEDVLNEVKSFERDAELLGAMVGSGNALIKEYSIDSIVAWCNANIE